MKFLKKILDKQCDFVKRSPRLKKFFPVLEATDNFFFGPHETTSGAPHIVDHMDIKRFMTCVVIALLPSTIAGIYFYGLKVLAIILVSYAAGGIVEVIFAVVRRKQIHEGFLVTGLIFPLVLPPTIPLWMVAIGSAFGVFFGKEVFGGTGRNIFNPALVGRVFLSVAFPNYFATMWQKPMIGGLSGFVRYTTDAVTSATPLIDFKMSHLMTDLHSLIFGLSAGSIGETFRIGVILGGLFLIFTKIVDWRTPVTFIATVAIFALIGNHYAPNTFADPLFQIMTGGLLFGAFFMATDPVTSPLTFGGKWFYGIMLGILTVLIRALSGFVEGVMFSILLMNAIAPLIDSLVLGARYRKVKA